ncbi:acetate--CoA ligase alpha subunit [Carboxydothermus hydrogenoformans]|uniref:Acetyl-CoA synthase n=1 Tax=Carboxydothermus hydrogenoformans (strain ATCC BAA-161 / DSM 6008 / Z-2901) TaxID=246194 RepID=Q3AFE8_CARHZ|nr:acetate--CoA ligase [Carboxydothermus hydrogenoformans]ABB15303.1 acetyl-CoA synthase [Carboxydothermus hydrogenoformans Z-2901]
MEALKIAPTEKFKERVAKLLNPRSIAVIGASEKPEKLGNAILRNIVSGYKGEVFGVNPRVKKIQEIEVYPDVFSLPYPVDLAVIVLPAEKAVVALKEAAEAGVKSAVVISGGFKETGNEGALLEEEIKKIALDFEMPVLGPNCVGIVNNNLQLNATFLRTAPLKGEIAFVSQSGAILSTVLEWSLKEDLGFSYMISMGNKAVLNEADFLPAIANDPGTAVILLYIEDVVEGSSFLKKAYEASLLKPVVVFKAGISTAGAKAASSHTGALAGSIEGYKLAFAKTGLIRAKTLEEMFIYARVFASGQKVTGKNIGIVTNSGGPGVITADRLELNGLNITGLSAKTINELKTFLPRAASFGNPVDILGDADEEKYAMTLKTVLDDEKVDGVVAVYGKTAVIDMEKMVQAVINGRRKNPDKPVVACFLGGVDSRRAKELLNKNKIPFYSFPEAAADALAVLYRYYSWREKQKEGKTEFSFDDIDRKLAREIIKNALVEGRRNLTGYETAEVLKAFGFPVLPVKLVRNVQELRKAIEEISFPLALKIVSPDLLHKSDVGGVALNIKNEQEAIRAYQKMILEVPKKVPEAKILGVEVQKQIAPGLEIFIGANRDPVFGPILAFGLGGIYVNLLNDIALRLNYKFTREEALEMIKETKVYEIIKGYRGQKAYDLKIIQEILGRLSLFLEEIPEIKEIDFNPVFVYEKGALIIDAKVVLAGHNI